MILEDRFVDARVFLDLQEQAVANARSALDTVRGLCILFQTNGLCTAFSLARTMTRLKELQIIDRSMERQIISSPFFSRIARYSVNSLVRDMKYRCRIPVPQSWKLVGVVDEGPVHEEGGEEDMFTLESGEIFGIPPVVSINFILTSFSLYPARREW